MDRTNPPSAHDSAPDWRQMCVAALREPDRKNLPMRIAEAEKAVYCFDRWLLDRVARGSSVSGDDGDRIAANCHIGILRALTGPKSKRN